jgi:hypothetical protein
MTAAIKPAIEEIAKIKVELLSKMRIFKQIEARNHLYL